MDRWARSSPGTLALLNPRLQPDSTHCRHCTEPSSVEPPQSFPIPSLHAEGAGRASLQNHRPQLCHLLVCARPIRFLGSAYLRNHRPQLCHLLVCAADQVFGERHRDCSFPNRHPLSRAQPRQLAARSSASCARLHRHRRIVFFLVPVRVEELHCEYLPVLPVVRAIKQHTMSTANGAANALSMGPSARYNFLFKLVILKLYMP